MQDPKTLGKAEALKQATSDSLRPLTDQAVIQQYESLRDTPTADETYPNLRLLHGTAFEREKDRREAWSWGEEAKDREVNQFYQEAIGRPCTWWLENQLVARHAFTSCMYCGVCTSLCPAARYYEDYNPRAIIDTVLSRDEERIVELLKAETLWYCGQCGSCRPRCPRDNNLMALISSLRMLAQLKGFHLASARGRQQYFARHLWGANFWNRGCSLYFRNADPESHPDFGPRWARYQGDVDHQMERLGAHPDQPGLFGGRKLAPETLAELRRCVQEGGTLVLWNQIESYAIEDARARGLSLDAYYDLVRTQG